MVGGPPSPPSILESAEVPQKQAFPESPEVDGVAPQCTTVVTQTAIIPTMVKGELASYPLHRTASLSGARVGTAFGLKAAVAGQEFAPRGLHTRVRVSDQQKGPRQNNGATLGYRTAASGGLC